MSAFRDSVHRDAIKAGFDEEMARHIADNVGEDDANDATRAIRRADAMSKLAVLYGAPQLTGDLVRAGVSLQGATALLAEAIGTQREMSAAGIDFVRTQLFAQKHWGTIS